MALHTTSKELAERALIEAQRAYGAAIRQTPGITEDEVDLDLANFAKIADRIVSSARTAWAAYRQTNDEGDRREFTLQEIALRTSEAYAECFGFSAEAATLLDAAVVVETV